MLNKIVGHEFQKNLLARSAMEGTVSHAYLFSGPDGVGKKLVAIEFAKLLNCQSEQPSVAAQECGCNSCTKVDRGIHPDVVIVEYEGIGDIKVDQVREGVEEKLYLKPFEGAFKIVIVDESERMNRSAQNAFLKTLEEPPPNSVIILITSRPQVLLPTIRSRCQIVSFSSLTKDNMQSVLKEKYEFSGEELELLSRLSSGSPGLALRFDKDIIDWRREVLTKLAYLDSRSASEISELVESMPTETTAEDTEKLRLAMEFISLWIRDLIMIKIGADEEYITHADIIEDTEKAVAGLGTDDIIEKHGCIETARSDIFFANANRRLSLENLFIKLAQRP